MEPTTSVVNGTARGLVRGGIAVFRGIQYAAPPFGDLRFAPRHRHCHGQGERDAQES